MRSRTNPLNVITISLASLFIAACQITFIHYKKIKDPPQAKAQRGVLNVITITL